MAEGGSNPKEEGSSWESWWGGWMQTAKEKSQTALDFVKKDLAEFGNTIQKETEKAVELTKGSLHSESTTEATKKVKAGLASFLDNVSKVLVIPHDDDEYIPMKVAADGSGLYDRGKARLHALQLDAATYVDPPRGSPEQFSMWLESFNLDDHKGEISELLVSKVEVRALYTKLVPSEVSNADFWQRYFYRVHQLQCDEARKQALMMRADQAGKKESVSWDDDDDDDEEDEDDEGNQSDWEKMPRPPQSYAAQQSRSQQEEIVNSTTSAIVSTGQPDQDEASCAAPSSNQSTLETQAPSEGKEEASFGAESGVTDVEEGATGPQSTHIPCSDVTEHGESIAVNQTESSSCDTATPTTSTVESEEAASKDIDPTAAALCVKANDTSLELEPEPTQSSVGEEDVQTKQSPESDLSLPSSSASNQQSNESSPSSNESGSLLSDAPGEATPLVPTDTESSEKKTSEDNSNLDQKKETEFVPLTTKEEGEVKETSTSEASTEGGKVDSTDKEIGMRVKGDMVVVGDRDSPSSTESTDLKDLDEWEQDFDVELTEEDMKAAEEIAKRLGENLDDNDDDWENWE